ncbi:hypothetical protein [Streptomyces sp. NPDC014685]|uniref:hypothetical protein n=1 Tax=Streptomyces sp. NPDC014685 TaxID=3364881 RepID=UPI0036FAFF85
MEIGYARWPVPSGGDAPDGPAQLAAIATTIDPHLVQHCADVADRDALYSTAPARTVAVAANGQTWIKTSDTANTWVSLWEPAPAWKPLSLASGMAPGSTTPQYKVIGGQVYVRGRIVRADDSVLIGDGQVLAPVPAEARPSQLCTWAGGQSLTGDPLTAVCRMEAGSSLVWWSQDGTGTTWVDISGSYWLD